MKTSNKTLNNGVTVIRGKCITVLLSFLLLLSSLFLHAENGYELWLRYQPVSDIALLASYKQKITGIQLNGNSPTLQVIKEELSQAFPGLLKTTVPFITAINNGTLLIGTVSASPQIKNL